MSDKPRVIVVILNWNGHADTLVCLDSLQALNYPNVGVVVIDNHSSVESYHSLQMVMSESYSEMLLIRAPKNLGFAGGNNLGLQVAKEDGAAYTLFLNNDTIVAPDFLDHLVIAAEGDPQISALGPTIYYHDIPDVIWSVGGDIDWRRGDSHMLGMDQTDRGQYGELPRRVGFITGCAMLVRMSAVEKVGPLDERFFAYYEETEWCVRATRLGYSIFHVPKAKVWHKITPEAREASPTVHYYMTRNRLLFLKSIQARPEVWLRALLLEYGVRLVSWTVKPKWRHKKAQRQAILRALYDFGRGQFGQLPS